MQKSAKTEKYIELFKKTILRAAGRRAKVAKKAYARRFTPPWIIGVKKEDKK